MRPTIFVAAFLALALLLSSGCISGEWKTIAKPSNATAGGTRADAKPVQVYDFTIDSPFSWGDEPAPTSFNAEFSLKDQYGEYIAAPGMATVAISDSKGVVLYNRTFHVSASDYNTTSSSYGYSLLGLGTNTSSYMWIMPYSALKKSNYTSTSAEAYLHFVPDSGAKALDDTDYYVTLPDELVKNVTSIGWEGAKQLNISQVRGGLEITLVRAGPSASSYYYSSYYDVEITMKNKGSQKVEAYLKDVAIVMDGTQYSDPYITPSSSASYPDAIYPGASLTKKLEFYDAPDVAGQKALYMDAVVSYDSTLQKNSYSFTWQ